MRRILKFLSWIVTPCKGERYVQKTYRDNPDVIIYNSRIL